MVKVLISRDDKAKNFDLPEYATQGSSGVDLSSAEPFERAMRLFEERLGEGEKLW